MPDDSQIKLQGARCPGPTWDEILDTDTKPVPEFLRGETWEHMGSAPIDAARYTSPAFFQQEVEKMWPFVWQFAARDEDMPDPEDFIVYENAGRSYLIVRQADGSLKAFHNVCLHRGRKLRTESGSAAIFKCPFHGFTWNTDGSFLEMPCAWDFSHLSKSTLHLPEASVDSWSGYIFIREALEGPSLLDYLSPLPDFFQRWRHQECTTSIWVAKIVDANWKVCQEAFMEAWHSVVTHPQILSFTGDANTRYNVYGDNVNSALTPAVVPSPHIDISQKSEQWKVDEFLRYNGRAGGEELHVPVPEGQTARQAMAQANRERYTQMFGHNHDDATDAEMVDNFVYNVFPNFGPWGGFMPNIVYRWRPWPDQKKTLMEVRILTRVPEGTPHPRSVEPHFLGEDEPWVTARELGVLGEVFDQDMTNLPSVQAGLTVSKTGKVNLADYQDSRVRHFHRTLDKYLSR